MDVHAQLAQLRELVETARPMPLSASCLVNRSAVLARISAIESALPERIAAADQILADADAVMAAARDQAEALLAEAALERDRRLEATADGASAMAWAEQIRLEAESVAAARTAEVDGYVESKLANLEVALERMLELTRRAVGQGAESGAGELARSLERTLEAVRRGRERLHAADDLGLGGSALGSDALEYDTDPLGPRDPETLDGR
ncbi:MAG: hypothetical protein ACT4P1_11745 [Sporichthyaceae bacterium]